MKKLLIILLMSGIHSISFAQWATSGSDIYNTNAGNVGIGTTSPNAVVRLDIQNAGLSKYGIRIIRSFNSVTLGGIYEESDGSGTLLATNASGINTVRFQTSGDSYLTGGNVGIGTTSPTEKLSVNGKIRAKEVKVETGWSDFVFAPAYKLPDLKQTEQYIKTNNHLPEIPSAKEVADNGINLGEMNAKLLQKIEELTLYVIEQNKRLDTQQKEIDQLKSK